MKKVIKITALILLTIFSLTLTILLVNFFLPKTWSNYKLAYMKYAITDDIFSNKYIFWRKPFCEKNCENPLEEISINKVVSFGEQYGNCKKILFLGDSFTYAPWDGKGRSYAEHFADNLSQINKTCYTVVRLGSPATNSDQQFAMFSDVVDRIEPDMVVWQFCWNDFFENLDKRLYFKDKNNEFKRISGLGNMYFLSGWIYQNVPLIKNTNLGMFLLYFGELKRDLVFDWNESMRDTTSFFGMNGEKIKYFLSEVESMSKKEDFEFITTLVPLECGVGSPEDCASLDKKTNTFNKYVGFLAVQNYLLGILKDNSQFVSMYENETITDEQKLNVSDFRIEDDEPGIRHLGESGLKKTGDILLLNFLPINEHKDN